MNGGLDDRVPRVASVGLLMLDLIDQDHRVAGDHSREGEDAKERDEAQRLAREEEGRNHADDT